MYQQPPPDQPPNTYYPPQSQPTLQPPKRRRRLWPMLAIIVGILALLDAAKGANVFFTCKISSFVKDDSGNTAGANVNGTDTTTFAVVQVGFPAGTDIGKINAGDTLEVWGTDQGVFSGQNALGGTVQEVGVSAAYLVDVTTGYGVP